MKLPPLFSYTSWIFFVLGSVTSNCVHSKATSQIQTQILPENSPQWTSEDCIQQDNSYLFIGYGEGANSATAIQNALINSRQGALACIMGGKITATVNIQGSNSAIEYNAQTEFRLDYEDVNWAGYEMVAARIFYTNGERNKVYVQYKWSVATIEIEKKRLEALSKKVDETLALKREVETKNAVMKEQQHQLEQLNRQEIELAALKSQADKAVARLQKMSKARKSKENDMMKIIVNLYCGVTVEQLSEIYREPDRCEVSGTSGYNYVADVRYYWDQFVVIVPYQFVREQFGGDWPNKGEADSEVCRRSRAYIFPFIYDNFAKTHKGYYVCKS